jgi:DNA-binding response OmpR family regulator
LIDVNTMLRPWGAAATQEFLLPKILVIDSDVKLLARLGEQLEEASYEVVRATDTRTAEALATTEHPDLILLNAGMNSEDGWSLLPVLTPRFPVIILSDHGLEEDIVQGLDAGAVDYVAKPFRTGELLARIRAHLRLAERAAALTSSRTQPEVPAMPPASDDAEHAPRPQRRVYRRGQEQEEPDFITSSEEHALLSEPEVEAAADLSQDDLAQLPLGMRLRTARQRRRITLVQAELESKIRMHYIQAMEEEKFALLPRGPFAEEMVRNYASYVGVDPAKALEEYHSQHFSESAAPMPSLGGTPMPRQLPNWLIPVTAIVLALLVSFGGIYAFDPGFVPSVAGRARSIIVPPTPTATPTATPVPTFTATPTLTPSPTATATPTLTPSPTLTATPALTGTATLTGTVTAP